MTMQLIDAERHYRNAMVVQGRSPYTVRGARSALKSLMAFLAESQITQVEQLDHDALMRYREALSWRVTAKGTVLNPRSQSELLGHMRVFCRWLVEQDWLPADPSRRIPHPRTPKPLPKAIMAFDEVQRVLHQPDMRTAGGFRDRVILEVLYTSAIRRSEVASLLIDDVDIEHGFLIVRRGKNSKDRAVPIGASVCALLATYLAGIRADWRGAGQDRHLFLTKYGAGMRPNSIGLVVKTHSEAAGLSKPVSTHSFRHACATHMMRAGAPIRHLQEMLGHASIESTQIYTRVTINDLREAHHRFHPREQDQPGQSEAGS
jgi:integrase/recombinase XerD